jgi:hypothetical protein
MTRLRLANAPRPRQLRRIWRNLAPILPLLESLRLRLELQGVTLKHELLVGPYPINALEIPVKAGFYVSVNWDGIRTLGTAFTLEAYMPGEGGGFPKRLQALPLFFLA